MRLYSEDIQWRDEEMQQREAKEERNHGHQLIVSIPGPTFSTFSTFSIAFFTSCRTWLVEIFRSRPFRAPIFRLADLPRGNGNCPSIQKRDLKIPARLRSDLKIRPLLNLHIGFAGRRFSVSRRTGRNSIGLLKLAG